MMGILRQIAEARCSSSRSFVTFNDDDGRIAHEVASLDREVIDPATGRLRLMPAAFWRSIDRRVLLMWCFRSARYGIPTVELVEWLRDKIAGRRAIEIGSGNGDLGYHLGIPETDSFCQTRTPWVADFYAATGQVPTRPPRTVVPLDALIAVNVKRPQVVVASWVTHKSEIGPGFSDGVRESAIVKVADYIVLGNLGPHASKPILALRHEEHAFPWLVSRAIDPTLDRLWVWRRQAKRPKRP